MDATSPQSIEFKKSVEAAFHSRVADVSCAAAALSISEGFRNDFEVRKFLLSRIEIHGEMDGLTALLIAESLQAFPDYELIKNRDILSEFIKSAEDSPSFSLMGIVVLR